MCDTYPCAPSHNACVSFNDVSSSAAFRIAYARTYSDLAGDLSSDTVARHNVITPNLWA